MFTPEVVGKLLLYFALMSVIGGVLGAMLWNALCDFLERLTDKSVGILSARASRDGD